MPTKSRKQTKKLPKIKAKLALAARAAKARPGKAAAGGDGGVAQATEGARSRGKYVYCVVRSTKKLGFGPIGLGTEPAEVSTVNFKDLAAVVSDVPMGVLDPTRENVLAHQRVNETVMREFTVLPMSFGTVFKTADDIMELLRSAYDAFGDV